MRNIVLASTSPYRRELLRQLGLPFVCDSPRYKETIEQGVSPELLVKHLSLKKAESLKGFYPDALIIGADQVFVDSRQRIMGKPGNVGRAIEQLKLMSGKTHVFYTGVSIVDASTGRSEADYSTFTVTLRDLSDEQIRAYIQRENPVDCAGAFKIEGLGIALMEKLEGSDYTGLIGLPLILLSGMLQRFGVDPLGPMSRRIG